MQQAAQQPSSQDAHGHDHPSHLAHHFETPKQQFESGKLGMWLFLATEILLFGGLFCAYAVYRGIHPEMFLFASKFLDWKLGAINTVVLLISSFTMAWAVHCAQRGQQGLLKINLVITFLCAGGFMCIKYVEYSHKFHDDLLWGTNYVNRMEHHNAQGDEGTSATGGTETGTPPAGGGDDAAAGGEEASTIPDAASSPSGIVAKPPDGKETEITKDPNFLNTEPNNIHQFFGIYFIMTGLHGFHVLGGMFMIIWLLVKAAKRQFGPEYFTPVDLGALYWHIVDLIWIFLFPLLYLI